LITSLLGAAFLLAGETPSYFEQARELYKEGPSKAPEIIEFLKKELAIHPHHEKATRLLGITYFGVGQFDKALAQFDAAISLAEKRESIVPRMLFYKARTLYHLKRYAEAKKILEVYWAFWQDDDELKNSYEKLYPAILSKLSDETS
jgi:tetratricopeptide (TPR) repeat protein